jgi:hypothetical protein
MVRRHAVARRRQWKLAEGLVDVSADHFEMRYGSVDDSDWSQWLSVARVGPPTKTTFVVEWIVDRADPVHREAAAAVANELDFYLVKKGEASPWAYAKYHCGASSNLYSHVHWVFQEGTKAPPKRRRGRPSSQKRSLASTKSRESRTKRG